MSSGYLLVFVVLLASCAIGLGAMGLGAFELWASANRFPAGAMSWFIARGFAGLVSAGLFGSFCYSLFTLIRPLVSKAPESGQKLSGILIVLAPAATGLLLSLYLFVAIVVLRIAYAITQP